MAARVPHPDERPHRMWEEHAAQLVCKWVASHAGDDTGHTLLNLYGWAVPDVLAPYVRTTGGHPFIAAGVLALWASGGALPPLSDYVDVEPRSKVTPAQLAAAPTPAQLRQHGKPVAGEPGMYRLHGIKWYSQELLGDWELATHG